MMRLTFELVAATNIGAFNEQVNDMLAKGYKFVTNMPVAVNDHEDISGPGKQYSIAMLLEEEV